MNASLHGDPTMCETAQAPRPLPDGWELRASKSKEADYLVWTVVSPTGETAGLDYALAEEKTSSGDGVPIPSHVLDVLDKMSDALVDVGLHAYRGT